MSISTYKLNKLTEEYLLNKSLDIDYNEWHKFNSSDISDDIKYILLYKLDTVERGIFLLYIYYTGNGGYNALAKHLGVSVGTCHSRVKGIKKKIKEYLQ